MRIKVVKYFQQIELDAEYVIGVRRVKTKAVCKFIFNHKKKTLDLKLNTFPHINKNEDFEIFYNLSPAEELRLERKQKLDNLNSI